MNLAKGRPVPEIAASAPTKGNLTLKRAAYNRIKDNMTYQEVVKIMGIQGKEIMRDGEGGKVNVVYLWKTQNNSTVTLTFRNNKLRAKAIVLIGKDNATAK